MTRSTCQVVQHSIKTVSPRRVTIRARIEGVKGDEDAIRGKFVLHCHLLDHEDLGMMQVVEVEPGAVNSNSWLAVLPCPMLCVLARGRVKAQTQGTSYSPRHNILYSGARNATVFGKHPLDEQPSEPYSA